VQQYLNDNYAYLQRNTQEWRDLADAFTRAEIEALERTLERDRRDFSGRPSDPLLTSPEEEVITDGQLSASEGGRMFLSKALSAFHEERTAGGNSLAVKTMEEHLNAVRMFREFVEADIAVEAITRVSPPLCQGSCPPLYFSFNAQVGGIER
jgi:hypothetical protein